MAYGNLIRTQEEYKRDLDKGVRELNRNINVSDYVYLDPSDGISKARSVAEDDTARSKLRSPSIGSFKVIGTHLRTIVSDLNGVLERVSADRVKSGLPPRRAVLTISTPKDLAAEIRTGPTYTVDRIIDYRADRYGTSEFLVRWSAYRTPT